MGGVDTLSKLFEPIRLNRVEIKNRLVMSAMAVGDGSPLGYPTEQTKAFYAARARSGVGLIVLGGCVSTKRAWDEAPYGGVYRLDVEEALPALRGLVDAVHAYDVSIFAEPLTSFGRLGNPRKARVEPVSASPIRLVIPEEAFPEIMTVPCGRTMAMPREITIPEVVALEDETAKSALLCQRAGFDGVEIGAHMSYLVTSFLSPRSNHRTDEYGGTLENRTRFLIAIVQKTRTLVGPDFPIGVKLVCDEHLEGGLTLDDAVEIGKALENIGVDYLSLAVGAYENMRLSVPGEDGALLSRGEPQAFKAALGIPIIVPSVHDPHLAADAIAQGHADMISLGRPLLVDPCWAEKTREGRVGDILQCDRDNYCIMRLMIGMRARCKLNPTMGREAGPSPLSLKQKARERILLLGATTPRLARMAHRLGMNP